MFSSISAAKLACFFLSESVAKRSQHHPPPPPLSLAEPPDWKPHILLYTLNSTFPSAHGLSQGIEGARSSLKWYSYYTSCDSAPALFTYKLSTHESRLCVFTTLFPKHMMLTPQSLKSDGWTGVIRVKRTKKGKVGAGKSVDGCLIG